MNAKNLVVNLLNDPSLSERFKNKEDRKQQVVKAIKELKEKDPLVGRLWPHAKELVLKQILTP